MNKLLGAVFGLAILAAPHLACQPPGPLPMPTPTPTPTLVEALGALLPQVALFVEEERTDPFPCERAYALFNRLTDLIVQHPVEGGEGTPLRQAWRIFVFALLEEDCLAETSIPLLDVQGSSP